MTPWQSSSLEAPLPFVIFVYQLNVWVLAGQLVFNSQLGQGFFPSSTSQN
jgi:hypothetical protein